MSWQTYVDTNLVGTGRVQRALIMDQQGNVWAKSAGYDLPIDVTRTIAAAFNNLEQTRQTGLSFNGKKFFALNAEPEKIYLKKGADGAILIKTKLAILVTEYDGPTQAGECAPIVESLADYLRGVGF